MFFVMAIAGMVCTALCVSGQFITDLKTGYWLGSTPAAQEKVKFIGVIAAAAAAGLTIVMLAHTFQFGEAAARRPAPGACRAASIHHEGAGRGIHEPPAGHLSALRHWRADHPGDGDARQIVAGLRARHVPAPEPHHADPGRAAFFRTSCNSRAEKTRRRARPADSRARRDSGFRTDGRRRAGRRSRRGLAAVPRLPRRPDSDAVLLLSIPSRNPFRVLFVGLCMYVWFRFSSEASEQGGARWTQLAGKYVADAVLGIDTLWGGDVMCPSGTGRFIADSWFSDEPLPAAYTHPAAARVARIRRRRAARPSTAMPSKPTCAQSICPPRSPACAAKQPDCGELRGAYLSGPGRLPRSHVGPRHGSLRQGRSGSLRARRRGLDRQAARAFASRSQARARRRTAGPRRLLALGNHGGILAAVDAWRRERVTPMASVQGARRRPSSPTSTRSARKICVPYLPQELARVPRANIDFLPIKDAWFSGSMNYIGRARNARRRAAIRSHLRDQRLAADFLSRIRAAGQPRGGSRAT